MSAQPGRARRKRLVNSVTVNARLTPELHERLKAEADRREASLSLLIAKSVEHYLPKLEGQELWPD